jgi:hypothetical protein
LARTFPPFIISPSPSPPLFPDRKSQADRRNAAAIHGHEHRGCREAEGDYFLVRIAARFCT